MVKKKFISSGLPSRDQDKENTNNKNINQKTKKEIYICEMVWSRRKNRMLLQWQTDAELAAKLHDRSAEYYSAWAQRVGLPATIFSAITTTALFAYLGSSSDATNGALSGMSWFLIVTSSFDTVFSTVNQFFGFKDSAQAHLSSKRAYEDIATDLDTILQQEVSERLPASTFISDMKRRIKQLRSTTPIIPDNILNSYSRTVETEVKRIMDKRDQLLTERDKSYYHTIDVGPEEEEDFEGGESKVPMKTRGLSLDAGVQSAPEDLEEHKRRGSDDDAGDFPQRRRRRSFMMARLSRKQMGDEWKETGDMFSLGPRVQQIREVITTGGSASTPLPLLPPQTPP